MGLLDSAVAMPRATFGGQYLHKDLYEMSAAYLFHIIQNHPFHDGNKRTGVVAALVFLEINGVSVRRDQAGLERLVWDAAQGTADKDAVTAFFRSHAD
jgi:death on curing protein